MKSAIRSVSPAKWVLARWLLVSAAALTVAGCGKTEDQPSAALPPVAQNAPLANAPAAESLPPAPAAPVSRVAAAQMSYAYPDRAYEMSDTFGDAPPDYVYDYGDDVRPWVWVSDDGSERVAEAVPGGERYYYYEAGAGEPFFVQDPNYGYGFQGGQLIAVYDRSGRPLPYDDYQSRADIAGRYLVRAHALYDASRNDRHLPVAESNWMARRDAITAQRQTWRQQINEDPDWRAYHMQNAPAVEAHWQNERVQRLKWAVHVDETMHNQDYAARERRQAQNAAAKQPPPASPLQQPPDRFAQHPGPQPQTQPSGAPQPEPRGNFARQASPQAATRQQPQPPDRFAQHPGPQPQAQPPGAPQPEPRGNFARQASPQAATRQQPQPQTPDRFAQRPRPQPQTQPPAAAQPEPRGNFAKHEPPQAGPGPQPQTQPSGAPQPEPRGDFARREPPQAGPGQQPPGRFAQHPAPRPPTPQQHAPAEQRGNARHEEQPSPQQPATAPPSAPHHQAAAASKPHPAPDQGKDDKGDKDGRHKHG